MTEFARLLHDAAGHPSRPLAMAAIHRRAAQRGLRRWLGLGLAGIGTLAGIGAPAGLSLLSTGDRPARVEAIMIDEDRRTPGAVTTGDDEGHPLRETASTPAVSSHDEAAPIASDGGTSTSPPSTAVDPKADTVSRPRVARARSCWVDNLWEPPGERRCQFTATAAGGWNFYQQYGSTSTLGSEIVTAVVHVTRDGVTATYRTREVETASGSRTEGCADDVIQPGDLVEVVLTQTRDDTPLDAEGDAAAAAGAGEGWGCTDPGRPWWATEDEEGT